MVCIYCSGKTTVTNSRPQKRLGQTWRRRQCENCGAIFSTIEAADLAASVRVLSPDGALRPFERDKLYMSVASALGHRRDAVAASTALVATITAKLLASTQSALLKRETIFSVTATTLEAFDTVSGVQYRAYHNHT